jgi:hypothetical protein
MNSNSKKITGVLCLLAALTFSMNAYAITDALKIKIGKGSYSDETIIRFLSGATSGFDGSYDSWKLFSSNPAVPNIFSKSSGADELAINAMPSFTASITMDVFLKISTADTYTISAQEVGAFSSGVKIIMKDLVTNQVYDLRTANTYTVTFPVISQTDAARFQVFFSFPAVTQVSNATCTGCADGQVALTKAGETDWQYAVKNVSGSTVSSGTSVSSSQTISGLGSGNYTVTVSGTFSYTENRSFSIGVSPVTLGATFIEFSAVPGEHAVLLSWSTGMESNTDYFTVERSEDGIDYEGIQTVIAAGNSSAQKRYTCPDNSPLSTQAYYRIKLTDLNGETSYSKTVVITAISQLSVFIFPNPAAERLNIAIDGNNNSEVSVTISDMTGREVMSQKITPTADHENMQIDIASRFSKGVYMITVTGTETVTQQKIIIN